MEQNIFSIFIPSWNNLPFLKLCVESIQKNSTYQHQIIIHVNEGKDGTLEWVKEQGFDYTYTPQNVGVCFSMNMMRTKVKTDYILFLNDDMYVLPEWDKVLYDEIKAQKDNMFFLSATTIQPHTQGSSIIVADYGDTIESFQEEKLLKEYKDYPLADWFGATLPPNVVHRDVWDIIGGYSVEYSPGMYSDPDFTAKLWFYGVRYFKGLSASRVYHFETKSTTRIKKNFGQMQFLMKWGITNSKFRRLVTRRDESFVPELVGTTHPESEIKKSAFYSRLKAIYYLLTKSFGPLWKFMPPHK